MTTHPFLRTLTGKILLRLAGGGAVVLLLTSVFGTYVLYRQAEDQATQRLADQVMERARLAQHVLHHTAETVNPLGATPVEAWTPYQSADFLIRMLPPPSGAGRHMLFMADGQLIADSALGDNVWKDVGRYPLSRLGGDLPDVLMATASGAYDEVRTGFSPRSDVYFAVARIERAGWYIATAVPGASIRAQAWAPALWAFGLGLGVLLGLLLIFSRVLRRHVAAPLGVLTLAAERLSAGDTSVRLPESRDDELGRLGAAFNHMAGNVAERDAALREDKRQIEMALTSLRMTEERWRAMTDNASDFIAVVNEQGVFRYVSPPVERMLGYTPEEMVGRGALSLLHPDDLDRIRPRLAHPTGIPSQFRYRHKDNRWRVLEAVGRNLRDHPAVLGLVLNVRDVTETAHAEEELARQRDSLHQSEKLSALGGLLAGVAHELNNPLAVVVGRASQLESDAESMADRNTASKIRQAAERCARIVKTFLAMARRQESVREPVDLNKVINEALDVLTYTMRSGGVTLELDLSPQLPPVLADADQLGQVFMNLFTNAHQAMASRPGPRVLKITSHGEPDPARVQVTVLDSGPGISPELRSRIFEPFFTTKAVGEGTGVGLSVSLGIVQSHNGTLRLGDHDGPGACFVLSLPALRSVAPRLDVRLPPAPAHDPRHGARILVVDDEVDIAEILRDILTPAGHRITLTHNGLDALRRLDAEPFDLVLTDLKMPGLDGPALYAELSRRHPHLAQRVIAITGDTLGSSAREFVRTSRVPVIDKPFEPNDVLTRVAAQLAVPVG